MGEPSTPLHHYFNVVTNIANKCSQYVKINIKKEENSFQTSGKKLKKLKLSSISVTVLSVLSRLLMTTFTDKFTDKRSGKNRCVYLSNFSFLSVARSVKDELVVVI